MLKNSNGFSLIESLVAASLLTVIISTLVPAVNLLQAERHNLQQERSIMNELHNELQPFLWEANAELPHHFVKTMDERETTFSFSYEEDLVKGCATWINVKNKTKQFCLYGYPDE